MVQAEGEQIIKRIMVPGSMWQQVPRGPTALRSTLEVAGALQLLSCLVLFHQPSQQCEASSESRAVPRVIPIPAASIKQGLLVGLPNAC